MHMLTIACEESLVEEVWALLIKCGIKSYTLIGKAVGRGTTDASPPPLDWKGHTDVLLVVLPEERVPPVVEALRAFRDQLERHKHEAPLKVFAQRCEVLL